MKEENSTRYYRTKMKHRKGFVGCFLAVLIVFSLISGTLLGSLLEKTDVLPQLWQNLKSESLTLFKLMRREPSGSILSTDTNLIVCADTLGKSKSSLPDLFWLLNYNAKQKKFLAIIIPRETVVDISGGNREELSKVYLYGKRPLMMSAVNKLLGLNIDNYVILEPSNFKIFKDFGHLTANISQYVSNGPNLGNQKINDRFVRFYLAPQVDDTRDPQMRIEREKEILSALKSRLETLQPGDINDAIERNYNTINSSLTQKEMEEFFRTLGSKSVKLESEALPARFDSSLDYCFFDPKLDEIKNMIASITTNKQTAKANSVAPLVELKIEVLNGTGKSGMAKEIARKLKEQGYDVPYVSRADRSDYSGTRINVYSSKAETDAARIKEIIGTGNIRMRTLQNPKVDIRIVVGRDYLEI